MLSICHTTKHDSPAPLQFLNPDAAEYMRVPHYRTDTHVAAESLVLIFNLQLFYCGIFYLLFNLLINQYVNKMVILKFLYIHISYAHTSSISLYLLTS